MELKIIKTRYSDKDYLFRTKAGYLLLLSLLVGIICTVVGAYIILTKGAPNVTYTAITAVSIITTILILKGKYRYALFLFSAGLIISFPMAILYGNQKGNIILFLPPLIIYFLFFTTKRITFISILYSTGLIVLFFIINRDIRDLHVLFLADSLAAIILFSAMSFILVTILNNYLKEKNELIREIHHRVNNNLQVISSLIDMQIDGLDDRLAAEHLENFRNRIYSMSKVHNKLYQSNDLSGIHMKDVIIDIENNLKDTWPQKTILFNNRLDDITLNLYYSIPLCMIVNELLSNGIKHSRDENVMMDISFHNGKKNKYTLAIHDNGRNIDDVSEINNRGGLGLYLVEMLTGSFKGIVSHRVEKGLFTEIVFTVDDDNS